MKMRGVYRLWAVQCSTVQFSIIQYSAAYEWTVGVRECAAAEEKQTIEC